MEKEQWFMGLDASTQSLSAFIIEPEAGIVVSDFTVDFNELPEYGCVNGVLDHADPLVKHADPLMWVAALEELFKRMVEAGLDLRRITAISGSGQQHGTVYLAEDFPGGLKWTPDKPLVEYVGDILSRPTAPIWMDSSTSVECAEIADSAGGSAYVQQTTGSPAIERFAGPQIRKFYKAEPDLYERTAKIHLVSSFMGSLLAGQSIPIDHGDGAGMNLMSLRDRDWDQTMLKATAPGLREKLPPVRASTTVAGRICPYFVSKYGFRADTAVLVWSGDNPNSLIGVGGYAPGVAAVSLGTSHTYFSAMPRPTVDPAGCGHVFGNPAGGFMSLICFKNGALAQEAVRNEAGLDWRQFDQCLRNTPVGNRGNMMLPYFISEITPLVLQAGPVYRGSSEFERGEDKAARVRAVVEAQAFRLRLHSSWIEERPREIRVTGGAARSDDVCRVIADVFDARVERLEVGNSAGLGAAMRAAQVATGESWERLTDTFCRPVPGQAIESIAGHVEVYKKMLPEFSRFAAEYKASDR